MGKRHFANKRYGPKGARLYCQADGCEWASSSAEATMRAQREEHRKHRVDVGDEVDSGPLKLEQHERLRLLRRLHRPLVNQIISTDTTGALVRGSLCLECNVPHPCVTARLIEGDATAAELILEDVDEDEQQVDGG